MKAIYLRKIRLENKFTQEEIAFELGITQKAYSKIENGEVCLSQEKLIKLSALYGVPLAFFCNISRQCDSDKSVLIEKMSKLLLENNIKIPKV
jgi:transcriptional regulator with XRE-family HTH domain